MDIILKYYTKLRIAEICGVQPKTVHNWFVKNNMPHWAIERLGFKICENGKIEKGVQNEIRRNRFRDRG